MTDENLALAQEPAVPAIEGNANQTANEPAEPAIEPGQESDDQQIVEPPEDDDDLDFGFKKYRVPKSLKEGVEKLRADYSQKTEAASHRTKEAEALKQRAEAMLVASEEEMGIRANLHHVNAELKRLENFDWNAYQAMRREDPLGADEAWQYVQHLKGQKADAERQLGDRQRVRFEETQRETAKRFEETNAFKKTIPGWTPEMDSKVIDFAKSEGITSEQLAGVMNPAVYKILNLARLGAQVLAKQNAPKPAPAAPPPPIDTVTPKRNPPPAGPSDRQGVEAWMKARNAQVAKRA